MYIGDNLGYGHSELLTIEEYIRKYTYVLFPGESYLFRIKFSELSHCEDGGYTKTIYGNFSVSYYGSEVKKYLKDKKNSIAEAYYGNNIKSNEIKTKGHICY